MYRRFGKSIHIPIQGLIFAIFLIFGPLPLAAQDAKIQKKKVSTTQVAETSTATSEANKSSPPPSEEQKNAQTLDETSEDFSGSVKPEGDGLAFDLTYKNQFTKMLISILIIILVALFVIWILRRGGPTRSLQMNRGKNIKIIERRAISSQTYLYHIEVGGKQIIIAESKIDVKKLTTLDWPENPAED